MNNLVTIVAMHNFLAFLLNKNLIPIVDLKVLKRQYADHFSLHIEKEPI